MRTEFEDLVAFGSEPPGCVAVVFRAGCMAWVGAWCVRGA